MESTNAGQDLFLASSEVLQSVLLPRLSAVDLFLLSLCSKGLRSWVLGTPPALWQDAPRDVPAANLASLSSTSQVLRALQAAHKAKQSILSNSPPVRVDTVQLPSMAAEPPEEGYTWVKLRCTETAFSGCGAWLAVVLEGEQRWCRQPEKPMDPWSLVVSEVVLYSTSDGFRQQARFFTGSRVPILQWMHQSPCLCLTQLLRYRQGSVSGHYSASIIDAPTGSVLFSLGRAGVAAVLKVMTSDIELMSWSPSCGLLLVQAASCEDYDAASEGWVAVVSVVEDKVVAESKAVFAPRAAGDHCAVAVAWHPSSQGIVCSCDVELEDAAAFHQAGFVVGRLPERHYLTDAGFLASGRFLIARHTLGTWPIGPQVTEFALLACSIEGQQLMFTMAQGAIPVPASTWGPSAFVLIRRLQAHLSAVLVDPGSEAQQAYAHAQLMRSFQVESPSGRFSVAEGPGGFCIQTAQTHERVWDVATSDPAWPELSEEQQAHAMQGDLLGLQAVLDSSLAPARPRTGHSHAGAMFKCDGWLPSGLGVLCRAFGEPPGIFPCVEGAALPPSLQCFWFA